MNSDHKPKTRSLCPSLAMGCLLISAVTNANYVNYIIYYGVHFSRLRVLDLVIIFHRRAAARCWFHAKR